MASSSRLGPQEKGKISVNINVKGKKGNIRKTIQVKTNDPANPVTILSLTMEVRDRMHLSKFKAKEIFNNQCSGCHVEKGNKKKGIELFQADCIMCHDFGKSASSILEMSKKSKGYLINAIRNGVEGSSMPGWSLKNSGPFGEEEIASLVDLISKSVKAKGSQGIF